MTAREAMNIALAAANVSQNAAAAKLGWSPQQLSQKMVRNTLRTDEFFQIMDELGIEVVFRMKDTGQIITSVVKGHGRRLKGMSNLVKYDTRTASALSNSFYADGVNEYDENGEAQELYADKDGRYFIAEYHKDDPKKDVIRAVPSGVAVAFIETYGTDIEKVK